MRLQQWEMYSEGLSSPVQSSWSWSSVPLGHLSHRLSKVPIPLICIRVGFGLFCLENFFLVSVWVFLKLWSFIWDVQTFWMASLYLHAETCMHVYKGTEVCEGDLSWPAEPVYSLLTTQGRHSYAEAKGVFWCTLCPKALSRTAPVGGSARWSPLAQLSPVWTGELLPGDRSLHLFLSALSAWWGCWCC